MTDQKIRQSEFAEKHGLTSPQVVELRRLYLNEGTDFWSEGRAIFWSEDAATMVESLFSPSTGIPTDPELPPTAEMPEEMSMDSPTETVVPDEPTAENVPAEVPLTVRVTKRARNYAFVYAELNGERIAVKVGKKSRKNLVGKTVNVIRENVNDETTYTLIP
jgi:hypothetical protein